MKLNDTRIDDYLNGLMAAAAIAVTLIMAVDAVKADAEILIALRSAPAATQQVHQVAQAELKDAGKNDAVVR